LADLSRWLFLLGATVRRFYTTDHSTKGQTMDNTAGDILKVALAREEVAHRFYEGLLEKHSKVETIRDILEQLKDEEYRHIRLIHDKMAQLDLGRL
jgi:rubrerythrin